MKNTFYLLLFWLGLSLRVPAQAIWSADFPFAGELPSNEMTELYQDEDGLAQRTACRATTVTACKRSKQTTDIRAGLPTTTSPALRKTVHTFGSEREKD